MILGKPVTYLSYGMVVPLRCGSEFQIPQLGNQNAEAIQYWRYSPPSPAFSTENLPSKRYQLNLYSSLG
jgi:hypothetical protein